MNSPTAIEKSRRVIPESLHVVSIRNFGALHRDMNSIGCRTISAANIWIPGRPVPKARPRLGKGRVRTADSTRAYEHQVGLAAMAARAPVFDRDCGDDDTVGVYIVIVDKRTAREGRTCRAGRQVSVTSSGDVDNQAKSILDGLEKGRVIPNDRRVSVLRVLRVLAPAGIEVEGAIVAVAWALPDDVVHP